MGKSAQSAQALLAAAMGGLVVLSDDVKKLLTSLDGWANLGCQTETWTADGDEIRSTDAEESVAGNSDAGNPNADIPEADNPRANSQHVQMGAGCSVI